VLSIDVDEVLLLAGSWLQPIAGRVYILFCVGTRMAVMAQVEEALPFYDGFFPCITVS
jgi:hypothetical protein